MAKSYLTSDELQIGNKWLKTVFFPCVKPGNANAEYVATSWNRSDVITACQAIYKFIVDRQIDAQNKMTAHFDTLGTTEYFNTSAFDRSDTYKIKAKALMKIFANVCAKREIFWDDGEYTAFELDYFKKTPFGEILWDFRCFVSQEPDTLKAPTVNTSSSTSTSNGSAGSSTPRAPRTASTGSGHTLYRNNAGGIVGTTKDVLTVPEMFCIIGEFNPKGKTSPKIHVSPQGKSTTAPLQVKYTSGQGANDCILYFDNLTAANDFKTKCEANMPANIAFFKVKKMPTDPNGYVEVTTNHGNAWIKASRLHEEVVEDEADIELVEEVVAEEIEQLPESYYREKYTQAACALKELLD
jgi:hypothetical protein